MGSFIIYILLLSIWDVILFYGNSYGISVLLFMGPLLCYMYYFLKKNKLIKNKYGLLFMIPILLLSITYYIFDSVTFKDLNIIVIPILFLLMYIYTIKPTYKIKNILLDGANMIFESISLIGDYFKEIKLGFNKGIKMSDKTRRILKSLLIVIPVVVIVLMLLSNADMIFENLFSGLINCIKKILQIDIFNDLLGRLIVTFILFMVIGIHSLYLLKIYANKKDKEIVEKKKKDLLTMKILITALNIIYIVFDYIQIKSLMLHHVSSGFNYANYAREGFFELMIVSIINISIILISTKLENSKENKYINTMSVLMVFLTLIIIISSFMRMNMYESAYGYTILRLFVYTILICESIMMIPTIMYIFNSNFNIVKSYMIIAISIYLIINYMNFDNIIAKRNINRYYNDGKIDVIYLQNNGSDNVKLLLDLYDNTKEDNIKKSLSNYFYDLKSDLIIDNVFEYNLSKEKALDLLSKYKFNRYEYEYYEINYQNEE